MVAPLTLKSMDNQSMAMHLESHLEAIKSCSPPDMTGALLVLWDDSGAMHFRGHVPQSVMNGDGIRKIAAAIDQGRGVS